jgi:hypothetical protein
MNICASITQPQPRPVPRAETASAGASILGAAPLQIRADTARYPVCFHALAGVFADQVLQGFEFRGGHPATGLARGPEPSRRCVPGG